MNALELLKSDHDRMQDLLEEALDAEEPRERVELLHAIRAEAKAMVLEGYEEHHVVNLILDALLDTAEESEEWKARLKVLKENIEHHIEEEEGEMFKTAKRILEAEMLAHLGAMMEASKEAMTA